MQAKRVKLRVVVGTAESYGRNADSSHQKADTFDSVKLPMYRHLSLSSTHVRIYTDLFSVLSGLEPCTQQWYLFLVLRMDSEGFVTHNAPQRWRFNLRLQEHGKEGYSESAIKNATVSLERADLIKSAYGRGRYRINPIHAWPGSEASRLIAIRQYMGDLTVNQIKPKK